MPRNPQEVSVAGPMVVRGMEPRLLAWAAQAVGCQASQFELVTATPYSMVWGVSTHGERWYLKYAPPGLDGEAELLDVLRTACGIADVPAVVRRCAELGCFLMMDCGGESARRLFERQGFDGETAEGYFRLYRRMQKASAAAGADLLAAGCLDWRLTASGAPFIELLGDTPYLSDHGLTSWEIAAIEDRARDVEVACSRIAGLGLQATIGHADLHDGNVVLGPKGMTIIDWAEAAFEHPFFSLSASLNRLCERYCIDASSDLYARLRAAAFDGHGLAPADLDECLRQVGNLRALYFALTFREVHRAAGEPLRSIPRMANRLRQVMQSFISRS